MIGWFMDGTAELVVAYREDWMVGDISRQTWLVVAVYFALFMALVVFLAG